MTEEKWEGGRDREKSKKQEEQNEVTVEEGEKQ